MRVLVTGLPQESLVKTAIRDAMTSDEFAALPDPDGWGAWSHTDLLLAAVNDRLAWVIYAIYASQNGKPAEPTPMRRPGVGPSAADRVLERRRQRLTDAHRRYAIEHDGAYPPPDWVPDLGPDD